MNRQQALELLTRQKPLLSQRFGVTRLALFGSTARNTAREDSDVNVLVSFDGPATSTRYFGVQFLLEDSLGKRIDLVTDKALRPKLRPYIEAKRYMSDSSSRPWLFYIDDMHRQSHCIHRGL